MLLSVLMDEQSQVAGKLPHSSVAMGQASLLELPTELRMLIYNLAVPTLIQPIRMTVGLGLNPERPELEDRQCEVALLHTNRQIRSDLAAELTKRRVDIYCVHDLVVGSHKLRAKPKRTDALENPNSWIFPAPPMCFKVHLSIRLQQGGPMSENYKAMFRRLNRAFEIYEIEEVESLDFLVDDESYEDQTTNDRQLNGMRRFARLGCRLPSQVRIVMAPWLRCAMYSTTPLEQPLSEIPAVAKMEEQVVEAFEQAVRQLYTPKSRWRCES